MRRPDGYTAIRSGEMSSPSQSPGIGGVETRIDQMMKILGSPLSSRRKPGIASKTFGIPLAELVERQSDETNVPVVVRRLCELIRNHGLGHEGIFRLNGNVKTIEALKVSFDKLGDANLEESVDVVAAASLLKLFLRELPEALIPKDLHSQFVRVQEENNCDDEECICQLKQLLDQLPEANLSTLRYLTSFLTEVSRRSHENRMTSTALGIVFGPNLFRVTEDLEGLRQQSLTNQLVTRFINNFSALFETDADLLSPPISTSTAASKPSTFPFKSTSTSTSLLSTEAGVKFDGSFDDVADKSDSSQSSTKDVTVTDLDDSSDQQSMTSHDSEDISSSESSPTVAVVAKDLVNMAISRTGTEHAFQPALAPVNNKNGSSSSSSSSSSCSSNGNGSSNPGGSKWTVTLAAPLPEVSSSSSSTAAATATATATAAAGLGIKVNLITELSGEFFPPSPDTKKQEWCQTFDDDYHEMKRSMERSQVFQRMSLSKTRKMRRNVRKSHSLGSLENGVDFTDKDSLKENESQAQGSDNNNGTKHSSKCNSNSNSNSKSNGNSNNNPANRYNNTNGTSGRAYLHQRSLDVDLYGSTSTTSDRPSHPFLELHPQQGLRPNPVARSPSPEVPSDSSQSPSPSPGAAFNKTYVPPLDLSILHEHGDGSEPIPINRLRVSWPLPHVEMDVSDVMLSPRTSQLKKKISANLDPNVPPSPPVEQDAFLRMSMKEDEAVTATIKHLNKRIYHLKRKMKQFEENFEEEYGYRPSHTEKLGRSDVKKHMSELAKARRDLKQLKEESLLVGLRPVGPDNSSLLVPLDEERSTGTGCRGLEGIVRALTTDERRAMEESLAAIVRDLAEKRIVANRPESVKEMNYQEVHEEKVAIQKSLLQFESVYGRPSTRPEMDIVRPIYDRYRSVKILLTKMGSPKAKDQGTELEPILEHEAMDFIQASPQHKSEMEESVSREDDVSLMDPCIQSSTSTAKEIPAYEKAKSKSHASRALNSSNLHELNTFELLEQHRKVKEEKKRLRRILHEFESEFKKQTGTTVQREDRTPLESLYGEYKQVKAKLRLLEALLSKHKSRYTV